jgi:hypothetical protein
MSRRARSALAALFALGLLIAMAAAASSAQAAGAPGTLDPSFGAGGKVLTSLAGVNQVGNQALVSDAALQSNGDIVVSGSFGLLRYLPDGKLDTSFGTNGVAQTGFGGAAVAIQPNGEYVVAGQAATSELVASSSRHPPAALARVPTPWRAVSFAWAACGPRNAVQNSVNEKPKNAHSIFYARGIAFREPPQARTNGSEPFCSRPSPERRARR